MHSDLHGNVIHHGAELLLLVSMLFLLAIPKSPLILKEFLYTSVCRDSVHTAHACVCICVASGFQYRLHSTIDCVKYWNSTNTPSYLHIDAIMHAIVLHGPYTELA